jgi:hypothetical protein
MRIVILLLLINTELLAQIYNHNDYFFSDKWQKIIDKHDTYGGAEELSYIGEYKSALEFLDKREQQMPKLSTVDSLYFTRFKPVDAMAHLAEIALKEKVIMINEAHHQPYHRVFTTQLLRTLYDKGFRYFGAETLAHWDTLLNQRKYPIEHSGYYTKEPLYANLIRAALEIGYTVFPYETQIHKEDSAGINFREIEQAKNIKKILDKDPSAKLFIHCGYDHLVEADYPGWGKTMAGRFIEYTGINPFTIDQVKLTERSSSKCENPFFKTINLNYFAFFVDSAGNLFNGQKGVNQYDVRLYHPRTKWKDGRPDWMFDANRKPFFVNDSITISYPCLVFAYLTNEIPLIDKKGQGTIPFDIIELKNKNDKKALSLKTGKYKILVRNKKDKLQYIDVTI